MEKERKKLKRYHVVNIWGAILHHVPEVVHIFRNPLLLLEYMCCSVMLLNKSFLGLHSACSWCCMCCTKTFSR